MDRFHIAPSKKRHLVAVVDASGIMTKRENNRLFVNVCKESSLHPLFFPPTMLLYTPISWSIRNVVLIALLYCKSKMELRLLSAQVVPLIILSLNLPAHTLPSFRSSSIALIFPCQIACIFLLVQFGRLRCVMPPFIVSSGRLVACTIEIVATA